MSKWFKQLLCLHSSWAKAGWKIYSARTNDNWYVCKECEKIRNFGFNYQDWIALPNFPINFDCSDDTYYLEF